MEESYETFEEELGPPRADPPPQKPVRQIRRPEMYATRKVREEMAPFPQQPRAEPKIPLREPSYPRTTPLHKALSSQNLTQIETPWENVTLNRCLFVAITILVLTSGFQRLHETLRGQRAAAEEEEEVGLTMRRSGSLRHRHPPEPETSLWEVMFWWLPDLDDDEDDEDEEDDDDDDGQVKRVKSKTGATARASSGLRNKPLPDKKLLKQREGKLKDRRGKKARDEDIREKEEKDKKEEPEEEEEEEAAADEEDEDGGNEEAEPEKNNKPEEKKEKKKTQKG